MDIDAKGVISGLGCQRFFLERLLGLSVLVVIVKRKRSSTRKSKGIGSGCQLRVGTTMVSIINSRSIGCLLMVTIGFVDVRCPTDMRITPGPGLRKTSPRRPLGHLGFYTQPLCV